jgi:hypothetical protein
LYRWSGPPFEESFAHAKYLLALVGTLCATYNVVGNNISRSDDWRYVYYHVSDTSEIMDATGIKKKTAQYNGL